MESKSEFFVQFLGIFCLLSNSSLLKTLQLLKKGRTVLSTENPEAYILFGSNHKILTNYCSLKTVSSITNNLTYAKQ